ncbi:SULFATED SURFACE-LIKE GLYCOPROTEIN [Salix viminalis]|uniref:SULFATED SURFACE-LIKE GLYCOPROTEIN n=1 Tax=Salix viminalis TaxID=40686 RepID=A0A9Q0UJ55_SALVM|nr:SULFATED SURFACE-LIKE GLYCOPROTEIN [Salix viminalis]
MASGWVKSLQNPKHHPINQNQQKLKPEHVSTTPSLSRSTRNSDLVFPALAELPEGHPSRDYPSHELEQQTISGSDRDAFQSENGSRTVTRFEEYRENIKRVVEIILHTSWSNKSFPGRIEMLFKVKTGQER